MLRYLMAVALLGAGPTSVLAAPQGDVAKIGPGLARLLVERPGTHDVLVFLKDQGNLTLTSRLASKRDRGRFVVNELRRTAARAQGPLLTLLKGEGASFRAFFVANVVAVDDASPALIAALAARSDVGRVIADPTVRVLAPASPEQLTPDAGVAAIAANIVSTGADRVWSERGVQGQGVVVAGQDTGIAWDHPALRDHYRGWDGARAAHDYHWHDAIHATLTGVANPCGYDLRVPCDDHGHGTHTIGTVAGDDGAGNQIGMAPAAQWIGCRNMDAGTGKPSTYIECFQFFLAPWPYGADPMRAGDPDRAPDVMNNSWGCPVAEGCDGTEFLEVLAALKAAGVMVVAAAGNEGPGCASIADAPAHHSDLVLAVGAVDHRNATIASFSSRGPSAFDGAISPDLSAPGVSVRSAIPGGGFASAGWSGTSMASPHATGAVALLWSAEPALRGDVETTAARLRGAATAKTSSQTCGGVPGSQVPNNTYGHGNLDIYRAVAGSTP